MKLVLELLGPPRLMGARRRCELRTGSLSVGRSPEAGWVIPDSERMISRLHLRVDASHGAFMLTDTSANGVFVNGGAGPVGYGASVKLRDGDRLQVGEAQIAVSVIADEGPTETGSLPPERTASASARDPLGGPFGAAQGSSAAPPAAAPAPAAAQRGGIDANWMIKPLDLPSAPDPLPATPNGRTGTSAPRSGGVPPKAMMPSQQRGVVSLVDGHPDLSARELAAAVDGAARLLDAATRSALLAEIANAVDRS